jgi:hypothetical protein
VGSKRRRGSDSEDEEFFDELEVKVPRITCDVPGCNEKFDSPLLGVDG